MDKEYILKDPVRRGNYKVIKKLYPEEYEKILMCYGDKFAEKLYNYFNPNKPHVCIICGNPTKFKNIHDGYSETCCLKCACQNPERQKKTKQTVIEKYGVDNVSKLEEIKVKKEQTSQANFGTPHFNNREKAATTMVERYGVDNIFKLESVKEKAKNNYYRKFLDNNDIVIDIIHNGDDIQYKCTCPHPECNKCKSKTFTISNYLYNTRKYANVELCTHLLSEDSNHYKNTSIEQFVKAILDKYHIQYESNCRSILNGAELDIYIPTHNIAIECNGIYWHSDHFKTPSYHLNKYLQCEKHNIQLLTIWEDWIIRRPDLIESMIKSKLCIYDVRIGARKCSIQYISSKISKQFLDKNHIQGSTRASIYIGMYYQQRLVAVMTFNKPRALVGAQGDCYELSRFCTDQNMQIIGGANRMLSFFLKEHNCNIVSFASNDISNGNLYKQLGFKKDSISSPYWYIDLQYNRYHRTSFTKQAIVKLGWKDVIDNTWTEREVTAQHKLYRVFDSGMTKWVLNKKGVN